MKDGMYRKGVNWNNDLEAEIKKMISDKNKNIVHSKHCSDRIVENYLKHNNCFKRRYNLSDINKETIMSGDIVSAKIENNKIIKAIVSIPYGETKNISVVLGFCDKHHNKTKDITCITIWVDMKKGYSVKYNKR